MGAARRSVRNERPETPEERAARERARRANRRRARQEQIDRTRADVTADMTDFDDAELRRTRRQIIREMDRCDWQMDRLDANQRERQEQVAAIDSLLVSRGRGLPDPPPERTIGRVRPLSSTRG